MTDLRIANVLAKLPDGAGAPCRRVDIDISGDRIESVAPAGIRRTEAVRVIDGTHHLAVPGFVNGHHHSHENFQKGRFESLPLELWMNLVRPLKPVPVTPEQVYLRTMVSAIEALRSGTTTIVDDLNVSPHLDPAHVDAAFRAYEDAGLRAHVGITLFDRPFFRGVPFVEEHFPAEVLAELEGTRPTPSDEVLEFAERLATTRHHRENRVAYIAAPSAPQRCTENFLLRVRDMADRHEVPVMIHVQETRMQVVTGFEFYGSTMIEYLSRIGFLKPATSVIHGVWVSPEELDLIAASGASVQHNPNSNLKLGSGLMPMREMLERGINVSLGTDGCGSIESVDMLRVLANTGLLHSLHDADHRTWVTSAEAFRAATEGGADALGRPELGRIAEGAKADIALYDTRSIAFAPLNDPMRQLAMAETGRALSHLLIDGEIVVENGTLTKIDEAALIDRIQATAAELRPAIEAAEASVEEIRGPYEEIHARCRAIPIPENVFPARIPRGD
ncbi:amidohydrolase family protein [Histidinibacterium aquaticum]|uniref:Amidohydrolase family protein n=1 Tax=Histidinibacterium aquaticum TaxID=2613962 RepID=A0A5J5GKR0_9RHOB|nr:amidohydrolase family protein [Histidinibacterium aquaticum]KAA9008134.1 amidohydrolase family protein [Histidinibacterium aquaticum]